MNSRKVTGRPPTHAECAALVRAAAAGDEVSLDRLLLRAQEVARRFSRSVCGRAGDADDAVQEALIRTYRNVGRIRDPEAFRPWLYQTVRNACLAGRRRRAGEPPAMQPLEHVRPPHPGRNPEQLAASAASAREVRRAMRVLPGPYREVLFLRDFEGLSTREVARVTRTTEDNVKTRLRRARSRLKAVLAGNRPHPSAE